MLRVSVGGIEFEGDPFDRDRAFMISPDGWSGWDDGTAVRREDTPRPAQHGSFPVPGVRDARVITISGWILASSSSDLIHMRDQLLSILADGGAGRMVVVQPDRTTWADVMLTDMPTVKVRGTSELEATFTIQFWAPDPRKYGETNRFFNGEPMFHYGNFPAAPMLGVTATSAMAGYTIHGPDSKQYVVTQSLPAGQTHTIDMRTGQLSLNGALQLGAVSRADTWSIPPGRQVLHTLTPVSGSGSLSGTVPDTFI